MDHRKQLGSHALPKQHVLLLLLEKYHWPRLIPCMALFSVLTVQSIHFFAKILPTVPVTDSPQLMMVSLPFHSCCVHFFPVFPNVWQNFAYHRFCCPICRSFANSVFELYVLSPGLQSSMAIIPEQPCILLKNTSFSTA